MYKNIIHRVLALLYLGAITACILIVIKPGASIFYFKMSIDNLTVKPDIGFAYRYHLNVNTHIFRVQAALLFEDGHQLSRTGGSTVVEAGKSTYSISEPTAGTIYLYFSSSDNSNPIANGRKYTVYLPLSFISRPLGIIYLLLLSPGLIWFLYFVLINPEHRKTLIQSPTGTLSVLDRFFENLSQSIRLDTGPIGKCIKTEAFLWRQLFTFTILAAFFYVFMEWIFFVTKYSFMSMMSLSEKVEVFLLSGLFVSILGMVALAAYIGLEIIMIGFRRSRITRYLGAVIPTVILTSLALLLIDNFTYTVFKVGIITSTGVWREGYRLLFVFMLVIVYIQMLKFIGLRGEDFPKEQTFKQLFYLAMGILVISTILAVTNFYFEKLTSVNIKTNPQEATKHPNILLLGSDGLSAENLSVYGYERDTTPRLRELAQDSLVAENAFPNSGTTASSVVSIMTGKLPTTTRFGFSFDKLSGINAFQHLPAILKAEGYKTVEYGVPSYVDAYSFNMQNGFDMVNDYSQNEGTLAASVRKLGYDNPAYFLDLLAGRISERILHIFFIRDMQNPYLLVTQPADSLSDKEKIDKMLSLLDQSEEPLFVHEHLMGTHGSVYSPSIQLFSKGEKQDQPGMVDFYDDAILSFDTYIGEVIDHLKATGQFENTIIIIYTDHDKNWLVMNRIPLIIHFPGDHFAGKITANVQNMDIAPTILDYLGFSKPDWMSGKTLLDDDLKSHRLIFSLGIIYLNKYNTSGNVDFDPELIKPPFYQFGYLNVIDCQRWYFLNLSTLKFSSGDVSEYTTPCSEESLLSPDEIKQEMTHQLSVDGFDTSSLPITQLNGP